MKYLVMSLLLSLTTFVSAESLFQVKATNGRTVLDVTSNGLVVLNPNYTQVGVDDTLMIITDSQLKSFISGIGEKGLARSYSVVSTGSQKGSSSAFEVTSNSASMSAGNGNQYTHFSPKNIFLGLDAGSLIDGGKSNVFIGNQSGSTTTGPEEPDMFNPGYYNTFVGHQSGMYATNSESNTFIGASSGKMNADGDDNTFVGSSAGSKNTGYNNTFVGSYSCGFSAGNGHTNAFFGNLSGSYNTSGYENTFLGRSAGEANQTGYSNVYVGLYSGGSNTAGFGNVFLGCRAGSAESGSNKLYIDNSNTALPLIWGDFANDLLKLNAETTVNENNGRAKLNLNGTSGNNVVEFQKNGNFGGSIGYNTDSNYVFLYHGDNVIVRNGKLGIGMTKIPTQKLDVNGNARIRAIGSGAYTGAVNRMADGTLTTSTSDIRLKDNITTLENSLAKINSLRGVNFTWKSDEKHEKKIGFIAQEVEKVLPELVFTNPTDDYKGINYAEMTAVLTEAVKELGQKNKKLETEMLEIKELLKKLNK